MKRIAQVALCSTFTLGTLAKSRYLEVQNIKQPASGDDLFKLEEDAMIIDTIIKDKYTERDSYKNSLVVVPVIEFNEDGDLTVS